ncbi:DsbA family protein [Paramicrobacterium agarici]|uniref:Protein-disulfide isomerase n=1 Tax=Paramicrobacterium agarici TaxID=630514 RepID=A0A2A9DSI2_9MICO|nr:thioredoxin domain-containing protein [Microbacterium agarici]PFG29544.1 protein-disulfide isomerase [Microbacterium agarici]
MSKKPNNVPPAGASKKQRQQHIRELARQERERHEKRERRVRWAWQGGIGAIILAVVAIVVVVIVTSMKPSVTAAGPKNMISDGILFTAGENGAAVVETPAMEEGGTPTPTDYSQYSDAVNVIVYLDYMCPYCGQFEQANGEMLTSLTASGDITLEMHPISFLDSMSQGTEYSTRAANAMAAVANYQPEVFLDANAALFANQPAENTEGLTDDEIWSILQSAGVSDENVKKAIDEGTFSTWVGEQTDRAMDENLPYLTGDNAAPLSGTPTVIIDGSLYQGSITDSGALAKAIQDAATQSGGSGSDGSQTDAPATEEPSAEQ